MLEQLKLTNKLFKLISLILAWFLLSGIDRSPREMNFTLKDLETKNLAQSMPPLSEIPLSFYFLAFSLLGTVVGGIFLIRYLHKKKVEDGLNKLANDQAQLVVDSEFEARNLEDEDREFFLKLTNTKDPAKHVPIIMSSQKFEDAVIIYKKSGKFKASDLDKIHMLRKGLQFTFKNTKASFICTQMLEPGTHLECQILHKEKNVVFMSNVLDSNETELLLKPPKVKSRPANMKQFTELQCRIRRENDADYEFNLKIVGQLVRDLNAVILEHTSNIRRLHIRHSERLQLDLKMRFEIVDVRQYEKDRQLDLGRRDYTKLSGIIKDMSAGGIKVRLKELPSDGIKRDDVFIFHLPYASLRKKLVVSVLDVVSLEGSIDIHCEFRDVDMLTRMKINQYLHRRKLSMEAA